MGSLELIDNHDQKSRGRYDRGNNNNSSRSTTNDLVFTIEDHDGIPVGIQQGSEENYSNFGFQDELDFEILVHRRTRRRRALTMGFILCCFFVAGVFAHVYFTGGERSGGGYGGRLRSGDNSNGGGEESEEEVIVIIEEVEYDHNNNNEATTESNEGDVTTIGIQEFQKEAEKEEQKEQDNLWQEIAPPNPKFQICSPPLKQQQQQQSSESNNGDGDESLLPLVHIGQFVTIPEAPSQQNKGDDSDDASGSGGTDNNSNNNKKNNDNPMEKLEESYVYALSAMDISDDASFITVGFADYAGPILTPASDDEYISGTYGFDTTHVAVGMVRTFAYDCDQLKYRQIGTDLHGSNDGEQFGHRVSTSADGKTLAISAPSRDYMGGNGFVNVYYLNDDGDDGADDAPPT